MGVQFFETPLDIASRFCYNMAINWQVFGLLPDAKFHAVYLLQGVYKVAPPAMLAGSVSRIQLEWWIYPQFKSNSSHYDRVSEVVIEYQQGSDQLLIWGIEFSSLLMFNQQLVRCLIIPVENWELFGKTGVTIKPVLSVVINWTPPPQPPVSLAMFEVHGLYEPPQRHQDRCWLQNGTGKSPAIRCINIFDRGSSHQIWIQHLLT